MAIVEKDASQNTPQNFVRKLSKEFPPFLRQLIHVELTKDLPRHLLTLRKELNSEGKNRPADGPMRSDLGTGKEGGE